jgi:hypothetical protein
MCSSPKGRSSKPHNPNVESMTSGMDYADYSNMVQRANDSFEKRQHEKALRKQNHPHVDTLKIRKKVKPTLWSSIVLFIDSFKKALLTSGQ